ncbi:hypothetical protein SNE40_002289 [Patella caerulea]|uniref:Protein aurora borealis n=1 Tax=Patella caerulea TaxID=87958 RepID=A0AAN8KBH8_PATCE
MEVSDICNQNQHKKSSPHFPTTNGVIQTLKFGSVNSKTESSQYRSNQNQHSNSLRSELFHRHINSCQLSKEHENMTESCDSSPSGLGSDCCKSSDSVFTISPLVNKSQNVERYRNNSGDSNYSVSKSDNSSSPDNKSVNHNNNNLPFTNCSSGMAHAVLFKTQQGDHSPSSSTTRNDNGSSGCFKTPAQDDNYRSPGYTHIKTPVRNNTPSPASIRTPKDSRIPTMSSIGINFTPETRIINPFDDGTEKLNLPTFSPSMFTIASTPSTDGRAPKPFRWSIDQMAALHPADIDEMPHHQNRYVSPDREMEERAQKAIDDYFANHIIAPSPFNPNPKPFTLPSTPTTQMSCMMAINVEELKGSIQKELTGRKTRTQDASCQTILTLPTDLDMYKVLEQYMTYKPETETNTGDELSTSSLRRKLFFQGDGNTSFSPVKLCSEAAMILDSPGVSPIKKQQTPEWERKTPLKTPSSAQFASSPIRTNSSKKFTHLRRSSSETEFMASPELSPINRRHSGGPSLHKSRSSGEFAPMSSLCTSPIQEDYSDQEFPPLPSPNMSPIRKELGASYLPDNDDCSDESTPHASNPRSYNSKASQFTLSPQFHTIDTVGGSPLITEATAMETESYKPTHPLTDIHDFSITDMETTSDSAPMPNSTNQDTGYQTASIQLTSLHTNLTSQFSSLPLKTESSIDPNDLGDSFNYSQSNRSSVFDLDSEGCDGVRQFDTDSVLSEGKGFDKAKHALEMVTSLYPESLDVSLNPVGSSTPTKGIVRNPVQQRLFRDHLSDDLDLAQDKQLGSEVALQILKRAGDDLARYTDSVTTETQ